MTRKPAAKRKAKSRPRKKAPRKKIPTWVIGAVLAAGALGIAWKIGLRPELRTPAPEEKPRRERIALTNAALQESLQVALADLGVNPAKIRRGTVESEPGRWRWAVDLPAGFSLIRTNVSLAESMERWGGRIWEAQEYTSTRTGGTSLRMALGGAAGVFGVLLLEGSAETAKPARAEPRLAIVIDDFGYSLDAVVDAFIHSPHDITLAILPGVPYSREIAERALAVGRRTILHLPMEPLGYPREDPGPGAVLIEMDENEILNRMDDNLSGVPGVEGISNHMGSAATEDPVVMRTVLREAGRRGLFFFDSLTTSRSVVSRVASECGVPCVTNDLFIDNQADDLESIEAMVRRLGRRAEARGWAVGIGHPHATTLEALERVLPELEARGIRIVPVSDLAKIEIASPGGANGGYASGVSAAK